MDNKEIEDGMAEQKATEGALLIYTVGGRVGGRRI